MYKNFSSVVWDILAQVFSVLQLQYIQKQTKTFYMLNVWQSKSIPWTQVRRIGYEIRVQVSDNTKIEYKKCKIFFFKITVPFIWKHFIKRALHFLYSQSSQKLKGIILHK